MVATRIAIGATAPIVIAPVITRRALLRAVPFTTPLPRSLSRGPFPAVNLLVVLCGDGGPHDPRGHDGGHHVCGGGAPRAPSMLRVC